MYITEKRIGGERGEGRGERGGRRRDTLEITNLLTKGDTAPRLEDEFEWLVGGCLEDQHHCGSHVELCNFRSLIARRGEERIRRIRKGWKRRRKGEQEQIGEKGVPARKARDHS